MQGPVAHTKPGGHDGSNPLGVIIVMISVISRTVMVIMEIMTTCLKWERARQW